MKDRNCLNCFYFRSYYEEYDCDEYEPTDCGRCMNENGNYFSYADDGKVCDLWKDLDECSSSS